MIRISSFRNHALPVKRLFISSHLVEILNFQEFCFLCLDQFSEIEEISAIKCRSNSYAYTKNIRQEKYIYLEQTSKHKP